MGTFKIRPTLLVQGGSPLVGVNNIPPDYVGWFTFPDPPNPTLLIDVFSSPTVDNSIFANVGVSFPPPVPPSVFNDTLRFSFFGNSIYLDGSLIPISSSSLPSGWTPLTAVLSLNPDPLVVPDTGTANFFLQFDAFTEGIVNTNIFPFPGILPSAINFINNGCGLRVAIAISNPGFAPSINLLQELVIDGTYELSQAIVTIPDPVIENDPNTPIFIGTKITIGSDTGGLQGVTQIKLRYIDNGPKLIRIITGVPRAKAQDPTLRIAPDNQDPMLIVNDVIYYWINPVIKRAPKTLIFYLPEGLRKFTGPITISIVGNGIQFSGEVEAGTLNVSFADASGIYVLDRNQTNDKLYLINGFTTSQSFLMLPGLPLLTDEEDTELDFYSMLSYPRQILSKQEDTDDDIDDFFKDFTIFSTLQTVTIPTETEIPSPFIKTGFLP